MRVFRYENGKLLIIKDSFMVSDVVIEKPDFVIGDRFIYELFIKEKTIDGVTLDLTDDDVNNALAFIDKYVSDALLAKDDVVTDKYYVNSLGRYIGTSRISDSDVEVETPPEDASVYFWDGDKYTLGYTINKTTGALVGSVILDGDDYFYINKDLVNTEDGVCSECQVYDFITKTVIYDIDKLKTKKISKLMDSLNKNIQDIVADIARGTESVTFTYQYNEALEYSKDNTAETLFIDALLAARNFENETKDILVNKILTKANSWKKIMGGLLGKYQNLVKQVNDSNTYEEISKIGW